VFHPMNCVGDIAAVQAWAWARAAARGAAGATGGAAAAGPVSEVRRLQVRLGAEGAAHVELLERPYGGVRGDGEEERGEDEEGCEARGEHGDLCGGRAGDG
jgi:hypothetical protein